MVSNEITKKIAKELGNIHTWAAPARAPMPLLVLPRPFATGLTTALIALIPKLAFGQDHSAIAPEDVRPLEKESRQSGEPLRDMADVLLFLPRQMASLAFTATGAVGGLIEDEQIVPRVRSYWHPSEGEISIFPTAFVETGSGFNVGGRAIARHRHLVSSIRGGYGGSNALVAESKLQFGATLGVPLAITLEGYHDRRQQTFIGLGQNPREDTRNLFIDPTTDGAHYVETRERFIASVGGRFFRDGELFLSSSLRWRRNEEPADPDQPGIDDIFLPGSVSGANLSTRFIYTEVTVRVDTRQLRGRPDSGFLFETYAGHAEGVATTDSRFARYGGRVAFFAPVVKESNVFIPKLVMDGLDNLGNRRVPFTELTPQPDFRGFDNRRDAISLVGSLEYRWGIWKYVATRLFWDMATIAPDIGTLASLDLRHAVGFGLDFFSKSSPLGSVDFVGSTDGFRFQLSFGVPSRFGDRQHQ